MRTLGVVLLCGAAMLAATGCSKKAAEKAVSSIARKASDASPSATTAAAPSEAKTYNSYVKAHNDITGMFYGQHKGLEDLLQAYKNQKLASDKPNFHQSVGPVLYLNISMLNNMLRSLKEAQQSTLGGDYQALETKGAQLLATAEQLHKQGAELSDYFKSKKYTEDKMAKAKANDAAFIQQWTKFNTEYKELSTELDKLEETRRAKEIARYEQEGKLREASSEKAMGSASRILKLIHTAADLRDPQKTAAVDEEIKKMESALQQLKDETAKSTEKDNSTFVSRHDALNAFAGEWRGFKQDKSPRRFENMVDKYNSAVRRH